VSLPWLARAMTNLSTQQAQIFLPTKNSLHPTSKNLSTQKCLYYPTTSTNLSTKISFHPTSKNVFSNNSLHPSPKISPSHKAKISASKVHSSHQEEAKISPIF
jgi:hypothetical protein